MENSTLILISCIGFVLLLFALFYYFNKKLIYQLTSIESVQNQIFEQHKIIERHDMLLKQLFGNFNQPIIPPLSSPIKRESCAPQESAAAPRVNPMLHVAPMVSSLLGAFSSIKEEDEMPINEQEINEELKKELDELKTPEIKEGRVDEQVEAKEIQVESS